MTEGLRLVLLLFAAVGYAGAGASLAVARYRNLEDGEVDIGMFGVSAMLFAFAALCTIVGAGWLGVVAFGAIVVWASYIFMAQHMGLFYVHVDPPSSAEEEQAEESPRAKS